VFRRAQQREEGAMKSPRPQWNQGKDVKTLDKKGKKRISIERNDSMNGDKQKRRVMQRGKIRKKPKGKGPVFRQSQKELKKKTTEEEVYSRNKKKRKEERGTPGAICTLKRITMGVEGGGRLGVYG